MGREFYLTFALLFAGLAAVVVVKRYYRLAVAQFAVAGIMLWDALSRTPMNHYLSSAVFIWMLIEIIIVARRKEPVG